MNARARSPSRGRHVFAICSLVCSIRFLRHQILNTPSLPCFLAPPISTSRYLKVETLVTLSLAFVINIFAVVIFSQFYGIDYNEYQNAGLQSAGGNRRHVGGRKALSSFSLLAHVCMLCSQLCSLYTA